MYKKYHIFFLALPLFFAGSFFNARAQGGLQISPQIRTGAVQLFDDSLNARELGVAERIIGERRAIKRKRAVRLDASLLAEKRGSAAAAFKNRVEFDLFPNVRKIGQMTRSEEKSDGTFIWEGRIEGQPKSRATLVAKGNVVVGNIYTEEGIYEIRSGGSGVHTVQLIDPADMAEDRHAAPPVSGTRSFAPDFSTTRTEEMVTIDMLFFYTDAVVRATGAFEVLNATINLMVREANETFTNSNIPLQLRVAGIRSTTYDDSGDLYTDIQAITDTSSRVASREIHPVRDELQADIVTLLVKSADACGMGWQIGPENYDDFEGNAFNVVDVDCASNYVLAHEIGHNLGAGHNPSDQPEEWAPRYNYSYGYQDPQGDFRTVMAYQCPNNEDCPRIPYFSNPHLRFDGQAMGVTNQYDNTRTIMRTRELAAYWRQSGNEITTRQVSVFDGAVLVERDEDAQGEELGVPVVRLPGSMSHVFRNISRGVQLAFTRNPERRADILINAANERMAEANTLARRGDIEQAARHIGNYTNAIQRVGDALARVGGDRGEELRQRAATQEIMHQGILANLERRVSADNLPGLRAARARTLEEVGKTLGDIKDQDKVNEVLLGGLRQDTSPLRPLRNLEVLQAIDEKAPESIKEVLEHAKRGTIRRLKGQLENLPDDKKSLLSEYVENAGGDETLYLKTLDDLKREGVAIDEVAKSKDKLMDRLGKRIEETARTDPSRIKEVLTHLRDGKSFDDLRILKDIERSVSPETVKYLGEIQKKATEEFGGKDIAFIESESKRYGDVKQIAILEDLKGSAAGKKAIEKIEELVSQDIRSKLGKIKDGSKRKEFLEKVSDDSPEAIAVIASRFKDSGAKEILLKTHADKVVKSLDAAQNPEKAARIQQALADKKTREIVERIHPDLLIKIEAKTEIGQLRLQCVDRLNELRVDVDHVYEELLSVGSGRSVSVAATTKISGLNAETHLNRTNQALQRSFQQLSAGLRDITTSDDAIGLGVRDKLLSRVNDLDVRIKDINEQMSVIQNTEGVLGEIAAVLRRMRELAAQSRHDTLSSDDRIALDGEYQKLKEKVDELIGGMKLHREEILSLLKTGDIEVTLDSMQSAEKAAAHTENFLGSVEDMRRKIAQRSHEIIRSCEDEEHQSRSLLQEIKTHRKTLKAISPKEETKKEEVKNEETKKEADPVRATTPPLKKEMTLCTQEYDPVCGVDGSSYSNRCTAEAQHGVKVAYEGECKKSSSTDPVPVNEPAKASEPQKVEPVSTGCTREYVPVCGTNGLTYQNICFAKDANVGLQYSGVCKTAVPTTSSSGPEPVKTETTTTTAVCTKEYIPVCGSDNLTYTNSCLAKQAGVGVQYSGECKTTTTTSDTTTAQTTTTPAKPIINTFCCSTSVVSGSKVTLKWDVSEASAGVFLNEGKVANAGSTVVAPLKTAIYTLSAKNSAGVEVSSSVTVTVK